MVISFVWCKFFVVFRLIDSFVGEFVLGGCRNGDIEVYDLNVTLIDI